MAAARGLFVQEMPSTRKLWGCFLGQIDQTAISIRQVAKRFGTFTALEKISLDIASNEFFTLLGPSGCGKTTLLRMIGGFETASEGEIHLYGQEIEKLPANKRPINTVFQQYALFPHMTVLENVSFGMRMLNVPKQEIDVRAAEALAMVQLSEFSHRRPSQLSGGQQQRVALARALAPKPKVLLLDEPLSALDLKLRQSMRVELKNIQQKTGITFIFVTHDQEEALTMSDRIAVMSAGHLQQVGTAREIYENPANAFVANFIGETNLIDVTINQSDGSHATCRFFDGTTIRCLVAGEGVGNKTKGKISIRPERLKLTSSKSQGLKGIVTQAIYIGTDTQYVVSLNNGTQVTARSQNAQGSSPAFDLFSEVGVVIDDSAARLLVD
jgi:spermidine/putrescine transport system ATP-binding protein